MTRTEQNRAEAWRATARTALLNVLIWGVACLWLYLAG
jgi:hypothetical protein